MVSFGYNTSAMAQRYFSVDDGRSARKVALLCCGLFFVGAFLWFIPPMAMRVIYPDLHRLAGTWPIPAKELMRSPVLPSAAWPDRRHAGGDVQRHHGKPFGAVQS